LRAFTDVVLQGIQFLKETGFIPTKDPSTVAYFLLTTDGLSKAMIGEYLGEASVETQLIWK
jgi:brefeldin A-inhibited guanine nucleotide-exchange protein